MTVVAFSISVAQREDRGHFLFPWHAGARFVRARRRALRRYSRAQLLKMWSGMQTAIERGLERRPQEGERAA